jgi:hypothetical protein
VVASNNPFRGGFVAAGIAPVIAPAIALAQRIG